MGETDNEQGRTADLTDEEREIVVRVIEGQLPNYELVYPAPEPPHPPQVSDDQISPPIDVLHEHFERLHGSEDPDDAEIGDADAAAAGTPDVRLFLVKPRNTAGEPRLSPVVISLTEETMLGFGPVSEGQTPTSAAPAPAP